MRAAAELPAEAVANFHHPDHVAIFVAEKVSHAGKLPGFLNLQLAPVHRKVLIDFFIDQAFHFRFLRRRHRARVREIERELIGFDFGAGLLDVLAQDFLQSPMKQVGGSVVLPSKFSFAANF